MSLILGLDGGGTKTLAALARRDGTVIALVRGEGLDPIAAPDWRERLRALVDRLGHEPRDLVAAVLGLPFHGETLEHSAEQERAAADLLPAGAVGARLTGGGFGGCAVVFCRRGDLTKVHDGLVERFYSGRGDHIIHAEPGPGAVNS